MPTHNPANNTPSIIARNAFFIEKSNRLAATVPVQAPVTGKGIETKKTSPQNPHFSTAPERLLTLINHHLKKRPMNLIYSNL